MKCLSKSTDCKAKCFKIALLIIAVAAALGGVVMLLWNWLIPNLFPDAAQVDYCQALGILVLSKILFSGFRGGCHGRWKAQRQHWESMSPEERESFKQRWSSSCCTTKKPAEKADHSA